MVICWALQVPSQSGKRAGAWSTAAAATDCADIEDLTTPVAETTHLPALAMSPAALSHTTDAGGTAADSACASTVTSVPVSAPVSEDVLLPDTLQSCQLSQHMAARHEIYQASVEGSSSEPAHSKSQTSYERQSSLSQQCKPAGPDMPTSSSAGAPAATTANEALPHNSRGVDTQNDALPHQGSKLGSVPAVDHQECDVEQLISMLSDAGKEMDLIEHEGLPAHEYSR